MDHIDHIDTWKSLASSKKQKIFIFIVPLSLGKLFLRQVYVIITTLYWRIYLENLSPAL